MDRGSDLLLQKLSNNATEKLFKKWRRSKNEMLLKTKLSKLITGIRLFRWVKLQHLRKPIALVKTETNSHAYKTKTKTGLKKIIISKFNLKVIKTNSYKPKFLNSFNYTSWENNSHYRFHVYVIRQRKQTNIGKTFLEIH